MKALDTISKFGYWVLISIPVFFLLISTWSYFSVLHTFGEVPEIHNVLEDLAEAKNLPIHIFPVKLGSLLITALVICYITLPFYLLINYFAHNEKNIDFHKRFSVVIIIIYVSLFLLIRLEPFGWYLVYILD